MKGFISGLLSTAAIAAVGTAVSTVVVRKVSDFMEKRKEDQKTPPKK